MLLVSMVLELWGWHGGLKWDKLMWDLNSNVKDWDFDLWCAVWIVMLKIDILIFDLKFATLRVLLPI
jgi:hypothetical protein